MVERRKASALIQRAKSSGRNLLEYEALWLLEAYGFPLPPFEVLAHPPVLSSEFLAGLVYPLVAKAVSRHISHKTDAGAVCLDIKNEQELVEAIRGMESAVLERVPQAEIEGWLVRPYLPTGTEVIAGSITDSQFGPAVMVGIGGILTEVYRDVAFGLAPLSSVDAEEMIEALRGQTLLDGLRGLSPVPRKELAALLVRLGKMMVENPEVMECDLNPIICHGGTLSVADARVRLRTDER